MDRANPDCQEVLRSIPSLDSFSRRERLASLPRSVVLRESRKFLDSVRSQALEGRLDGAAIEKLFASKDADERVTEMCETSLARKHRRVINGTGIVLHTGLGRAPLADAACEAILDAGRYSIVEVDAATGERNQRESVVAELLQELTGAAGALVVNNNAAAVNLILTALAKGREAVVSRGQLVEIGGGFRMPDVMAQAGCDMVEVGSTNRTHLRDFETAINSRTALLLIVHTSNFRVEGFTAMPTRRELVELGRLHGLQVVDDLGSGLLYADPIPGLEHEPRISEPVADEIGLTCFSGDKLLGGPQCGILVGDAELVAAARANPLYRAFRCDKLTLAGLEATLRIYRDGDPATEIPTLASLLCQEDELRVRAEDLASRLETFHPQVMASESFAGSGANPARPLPSFAVSLPGGERVAAALRGGPEEPVFTRILNDRVLLDMRTLQAEDLEEVANLVIRKLGS